MQIGIDLGGHKIEAIALSKQGIELFRARIPTPAGDYEAIVKAIRSLVLDTETQTGQTGSVGIGIPGTQSRATGLVKNANSICLIGKPFKQDLEQALSRPVRMANDANCFALSEATDGAASDARVVFGVILGTGVGGGLAISGHIIEGPNSITGEWGHNPLPWPAPEELPGELCYCGLHGCIETFLSGPALARLHKTLTGTQHTAAEICNGPHEDTFRIYENRLARALAHVINMIDPDVIVLGGGVSNMDRWYSTVPELWGQWVFSDTVETRLVKNLHGDSSGVRGAAWLWPAGEA